MYSFSSVIIKILYEICIVKKMFMKWLVATINSSRIVYIDVKSNFLSNIQCKRSNHRLEMTSVAMAIRKLFRVIRVVREFRLMWRLHYGLLFYSNETETCVTYVYALCWALCEPKSVCSPKKKENIQSIDKWKLYEFLY